MTDRTWLTRSEAADYLGVSLNTLDRLRFYEGLPYLKWGKHNSAVRIDQELLAQWVKDRERTGAA